MKRNYSYFIVKPDGIRYIDSICKTIESKFEDVIYYRMEDFESIIKKLYHKHYEKKGQAFSNAYDSYLYGIKEIFGNQSLLILIADANVPEEDFMKKVYETKQEIRKEYVNDDIGIATNYKSDNIEEKNYIKIISENGKENSLKILNTPGNHRINNLNIIHSPDPNKQDTLDELNILMQENCICDKYRITYKLMEKIKKYKTFSMTKDMDDPMFEWEASPDLSGFYKSEIQNFDDNFGDSR